MNLEPEKLIKFLKLNLFLILFAYTLRFLLIYNILTNNYISLNWFIFFLYLILLLNGVFRLFLSLGAMISRKLTNFQKNEIIVHFSTIESVKNLVESHTTTKNVSGNHDPFNAPNFNTNNMRVQKLNLTVSVASLIFLGISAYVAVESLKIQKANIEISQKKINLEILKETNREKDLINEGYRARAELNRSEIDLNNSKIEMERLKKDNNIQNTAGLLAITQDHLKNPGPTTLSQKLDARKSN